MADVLSGLARSDERGPMIYLIIGLVLSVTGGLHLLGSIDTLDKKICQVIQSRFNRDPWISFFQEIWFLGRTVFIFIVLTLLVLYDWKSGLIAQAVFLLTVGVEQVIKLTFNRPRPYLKNELVQMIQPKEPTDSSFPSGDTLRIWFLAMILPVIAGSNIYLLIGLIALSLLVSIGRIILGVHHPTDILTGAGLGILGAGATILVWQFLNLS